jgi:ribosomal protein L22
MPDENDKKEKKAAAPKEPKEAKKTAAKKEPKAAAKKDADKPAAKKDAKAAPKAESKKDAGAKEPKAEKAAGKDAEKKPRRKLAKKGSRKADAKKEPAKKAPRKPEELPVVRASARYVRIAPRKARLIADQVRGMHIEQARALLEFSPRSAAQDIHKLINSAAANAENNHDLVGDEMRITSITVDEGPTLRRFRPRALGRATPINKRTSHIAVALTPVED